MPPLIEPVVLQPLIMANDLGVDGLHRTGLERRSFARIQDAIEVPTLIETQINSFDWFRKEGLRELFDEISPITDFTGKNMELRFLDYVFGEPRYDEYECRERDMTYAAPLRVNVQLHILSTGELKESEIFLGDFPLMTENGTFVINGAERVVVSQLIRSPGVYFKEEKDPTSGRGLHSAKLIPNRGAWLEFETNKRDVVSVKVDRKRKIPVTILLRAVLAWQAQPNGEGHWVPDNELEHKGHDEDVLELFQHMEQSDHQYIKVTLDKDPARHSKEALMELYKRLRPGDPPTLDNARSLLESLLFSSRRYDLAKVGRYKLNKNLWEKDPRPEARANAPDAKVRVLRPDDIYKIVERLDRSEQWQGCRRRYRPPGQPACSHGRRADPAAVPRRPAAHGARGQGAHVAARSRYRHAERAGQYPAGRRGDARVLRRLAALAVHGSNQPAGRADQQAAAFGAWAGRPEPRPRRLRGARRSPFALRPDLPGRDAGRPEHRFDRHDVDVLARE